jgi:hypothetical protein
MSARYERPWSRVPKLAGIALSMGILSQAALYFWQPPAQPKGEELGAPPSARLLAAVALGDPLPVAAGLNLYLQSFEMQPGLMVAYRSLDYSQVERWLVTSAALDPANQTPHLAASRIYGDIPDLTRMRLMLDLTHRQFAADPNRRWPWLAHAAYLAKHRLKDLPLARQYARTLAQGVTDPSVPVWARQMEVFILEDMGEKETARIMLGGIVASGQVNDARDLARLRARLKALEGQ